MAFQFRKLDAAPGAAVTIAVYYKGTTDLVPNLIDFDGNPLANPFTISAAGGADHWWFDSTNRAVVDILWTEEARIIAKGDVIGGEVYRGTALPDGADPADYPIWYKTDEDAATVSITSTPQDGNTEQGISAHWASTVAATISAAIAAAFALVTTVFSGILRKATEGETAHTIDQAGIDLTFNFEANHVHVVTCATTDAFSINCTNPPASGTGRMSYIIKGESTAIAWTGGGVAFANTGTEPTSVNTFARGEIEYIGGEWRHYLVEEG